MTARYRAVLIDINAIYAIIIRMKKVLLLLLCVFILGACGVKSNLERPTGPLRDYPLY